MDKNNDDIKKKSEEIEKTIKDSKKELEELQGSCNHEEYSVKQVVKEEGSIRTAVQKVCDFCGKHLGYPSPSELKENGFS
jgi:hypothetical protein